MKNVTVFCGSAPGSDSKYVEQATELGKRLAQENIAVVYGGAKIGLMGAVADGALQNGGRAIGVIPHFLQKKEVAHTELSEMHVVDTMHERKTKMNELCDAVITLPGGFGTMEELFEMLTWGQLGLHGKPIGILNTNGYYNTLIAMLDHMVEQGFLRPKNRSMLLVSDTIEDLLTQLRNYEAPQVGKWITKETT